MGIQIQDIQITEQFKYQTLKSQAARQVDLIEHLKSWKIVQYSDHLNSRLIVSYSDAQ